MNLKFLNIFCIIFLALFVNLKITESFQKKTGSQKRTLFERIFSDKSTLESQIESISKILKDENQADELARLALYVKMLNLVKVKNKSLRYADYWRLRHG